MPTWTTQTRRLICSLVCMIIICATASSSGYAHDSKRILILHSYHAGLPWTDQIMLGIQSVLDKANNNITVDVEYLDTKRHHDSEYFYHVLDAIMHYKFKGRKYDLVLVSDNEALHFALQHRKLLLGTTTPIVFCGINCGRQALSPRLPQVAGVRADPDYQGVLRQALTFHPQTRQVVVIGSTKDRSDRTNYQQLLELSDDFPGDLKFIFWNDIPSELLTEQLSELPKDTLVFINGSVWDKDSNLLSFNEQNQLLQKSTRVPTYSFWDVYLGEGIVGGTLINARSQGKQAAEIALRILQGELPGSIPIVKTTTDIASFDFRMLQRFGITTHQLPEKHRLVHAPPSSYEISKTQLWAMAGIFGLLLVGTLVLSQNNLRRRQAETLLRQSEQSYKQLSQQFQVILDGIPDGLTLISKDMKVIWSNKWAGNYFNKPLGSIPGEYCCKLLYNRQSLCENCPAIQSLESGMYAEAIITTPDRRSLEVKAFPLKAADGSVIQVITLASDVTEKLRLIEENNRNGRLASLGELAAGVAHEINNPNALILLNAELVKKAYNDAAPVLQKHYEQHGEFYLSGLPYSEFRNELPHLYAEMLESAGRIKRIVNDLKDFARQSPPAEIDSIDLNEAVRVSIRLTGNAIKEATNHFTTDLATTLPPLYGNLQRIEQVIINLILNACQALTDKNDGISIATYFDETRQACVIKIADEGCGISRENLPHITDPFFTTKREKGGTGLGLSVSMRIIRDYHGDIEFFSTPDQGTTVRVYLPVTMEVSPSA